METSLAYACFTCLITFVRKFGILVQKLQFISGTVHDLWPSLNSTRLCVCLSEDTVSKIFQLFLKSKQYICGTE